MKRLPVIKIAVGVLFAFPNMLLAQSTYLTIEDTRSTATLPADYVSTLRSSFKMGTSVGFSDAVYYTLLGLRGWRDDSGGPAHELAFSGTKGIYYRTGTQAAGWTGWRKVLSENIAGNVGVGTDVPKEKLSVNGKIRAHEIKVETANWPDYVFNSEYRLPSLSETETFIRKNGHLPDVPKAAEVENDGIQLGEMNKILLKKIEELTLHVIQQEKRINELQRKIAMDVSYEIVD
ncbi:MULTISPECIES: hypothetical protein [Sphingobacterium]|uniref:hypothetical protein n=1 Tax=Sphingobacterium TaxID=28453 RepID=UPI00257DF8A8|nr:MULTISPECIES: hypothetical protein [Sphingobacterium]